MATARKCKTCSKPLGAQAYKCPGCDEMNPTPAYYAAVGLVLTFVGLIVIVFLAAVV